MPKRYSELSRRQQNRRLFAYRRNDRQLQTNMASRSTVNQPQEIPVTRCDVDTGYSEFIQERPQNDSDNECDGSTSEELLFHGSHDLEINDEQSDGNLASENLPLAQWLCRWAVKYNIRQNALTPLLQNLHSRGHNELPRNSRTLLQTPRRCNIQSWSLGSYFHYGLKRAIIDQLVSHELTFDSNIILIDLNIDGLPLSKSSKSQLWPILGKINHKECDQPFVIGAYHGNAKPPSVSEFLMAFIEEYESLHNIGFHFRNKLHTLSIRAIICDAPARSYVSCTKSHNGYFGCGKCMEEGHHDNHRMLFLNCNAPLRTDENFRSRIQEEHHTGYSPFERVSIGMVSQFPNDPLHLMFLGIVKKLILLFLNGYHTGRLSSEKARELSKRLSEISQWIPKEFARKPRGLDEVPRWKGTEFRLFLLYVGPVVLQDILPYENLMHFNTLNCAARILSHPVDCYINNDYARDLLIHFVETCKILYGESTVIFNVHNLIHINEDVKKFGPLDNFSAWPFENHMQSLKNMLRKAEKPLCQLYNRLNERSQLTPDKNKKRQSAVPVFQKKTEEQLPLNCTDGHRSIQFINFQLTNQEPDNCCILKDKSIVLIEHIGFKNNVQVIIGRKFTDREALPVYPCQSTDLDMYVVNTLSDLQIWRVEEIENKTLKLPFRRSWSIIPFLHSGLE